MNCLSFPHPSPLRGARAEERANDSEITREKRGDE
jgi:hypothetical protein